MVVWGLSPAPHHARWPFSPGVNIRHETPVEEERRFVQQNKTTLLPPALARTPPPCVEFRLSCSSRL